MFVIKQESFLTEKFIFKGVTTFVFHFFIFGLFFFRVVPEAFGGSQARGLIGAVAASLYHSHSNMGREPPSVTYTTAHGNAGSLTH